MFWTEGKKSSVLHVVELCLKYLVLQDVIHDENHVSTKYVTLNDSTILNTVAVFDLSTPVLTRNMEKLATIVLLFRAIVSLCLAKQRGTI